jgi:hypothetical protein
VSPFSGADLGDVVRTMNDKVTSCTFSIRFPVWILVDEKAMEKAGLPGAQRLVTYLEKGYVFLAFTDEDLAGRFIKEAGSVMAGVVPMAVLSAKELAALITECKRARITLAAFDLGFKAFQPRILADIEKVLEYLRSIAGQ